ncbi:MAG: GTP-binding protein, partial [Thauera propionica]|nr:GTP-binding protein [Thauera propionica]
EAGRGALAERLAALNPGARQIEVAQGVVAPDALFDCGLYDAAGKHPDVAAWLGEEAARAARQRAATAAPVWRKGGSQAPVVTHDDGPSRHDAGVHSFVLTFDQPLSWYEFSDGLGLLLQVYGARILRLKGLLNVIGDPLPRVLQCVQHSLYPTTSLPAWPDTPPYDDRRSRLVFIVRDLSEDEVVAILGSFTGQEPLRAG